MSLEQDLFPIDPSLLDYPFTTPATLQHELDDVSKNNIAEEKSKLVANIPEDLWENDSDEEDGKWEYEYDEEETEDFYVIADFTGLRIPGFLDKAFAGSVPPENYASTGLPGAHRLGLAGVGADGKGLHGANSSLSGATESHAAKGSRRKRRGRSRDEDEDLDSDGVEPDGDVDGDGEADEDPAEDPEADGDGGADEEEDELAARETAVKEARPFRYGSGEEGDEEEDEEEEEEEEVDDAVAPATLFEKSAAAGRGDNQSTLGLDDPDGVADLDELGEGPTSSDGGAKVAMQVLGIGTANPVVSFGGSIFRCQWSSTVGTDMLFVPAAKLAGRRGHDSGESECQQGQGQKNGGPGDDVDMDRPASVPAVAQLDPALAAPSVDAGVVGDGDGDGATGGLAPLYSTKSHHLVAISAARLLARPATLKPKMRHQTQSQATPAPGSQLAGASSSSSLVGGAGGATVESPTAPASGEEDGEAAPPAPALALSSAAAKTNAQFDFLTELRQVMVSKGEPGVVKLGQTSSSMALQRNVGFVVHDEPANEAESEDYHSMTG